jgi:hypothetical protein
MGAGGGVRRHESFATVLKDFLACTSTSEREFIHMTSLHPTTFAELKCGLDSCNELVLVNIVKRLRLDREWTARFYLAMLAERDGEELLRAAGFIE